MAPLTVAQKEAQDRQIMANFMRWMASKGFPSSTPSPYYAHGPTGLFSDPAVEQALYSAVMTPYTGLQYMLPIRGTVKTDPLFEVVTGVTETTGSEPVGVCDDPPTAGLLKVCDAWYPLGRVSRQTQVVDVSRGNRLVNRGEHTDFILYGSPMGMDGNPMVPTMPASFGGMQVSEASKKMIEWMVAWSRDFARMIYNGNPTNNTAQGGYKEPFGLDIIINTGQQDAVTQQLCAARDSIVRSFGGVNISTGTAAQQGALVRLIAYVFRNLQYIAANTNLAPVTWAIAMPFGLFYELTEFWPIAYSTYRATQIPTGSTNFVDSGYIERVRDDMRGDIMTRRGQYLLIDGQKVPVVLDDAITETAGTLGSFTAPIYFVPLTVAGGQPATYLEYMNYDRIGVRETAAPFAPTDQLFTTDAGRFLMHKKPLNNWCAQMIGLTEWRVVMTVPQLAAKITNVGYSPLIHERSWDPSSNYFANGGKVIRPGPSYYRPSA
jgi:hypothetical protein